MVRFAAFSLIICLAHLSIAQTDDPAAGLAPFSTQAAGTIDSVDLATSNIFIRIPIRTKRGKLSLSYSLTGNFHVAMSGGSGTPEQIGINPDIQGSLELSNPNPFNRLHIVYSNGGQCGTHLHDAIYTYTALIDTQGTWHRLPSGLQTDAYGCLKPLPAVVSTTDGSGITALTAPYGQQWTFYNAAGDVNLGNSYSTNDPDGTALTQLGEGPGENIEDSLWSTGQPYFLSGTGDGSISNSSSNSYTYTDGAGLTQAYTTQRTSYTLQSNFVCSVPDYPTYPPAQAYLVTSIVTPIGSYTISYEQTPGTQFQGTGTYGPYSTGRIATITTPTGGYVQYGYSGGNNGIDCTTWVVPTLTRTVSDNNGGLSMWKYVNNGVGQVTETDPANNQTVYTFSGEYQSSALYYQGAATGTPLRTILTCYDGYFGSNCASYAGSGVSQTDVYTSFNGSASNLVETKFDTYGNVTEVKRYDFVFSGPVSPSGQTPLSDTLTYYGQSWNGTSCTAYPSGTYIYNTPCYSYTKNAANTTVAQTQITYSTTGHALTTTRMTSGSGTLTATATFNSTNGTVVTSTGLTGVTSTYAYNGTGGCAGLLPTSVTAGGLTTSTQWDCNGAVVTQTADANGQATNYTYNDPLYRVMSITDPMGDLTTYSYHTPTTSEVAMNFATTSTSDTLVTTDGLGRQILSQQRQAQGSSSFDTTQTKYGWTAGLGAVVTRTPPLSGSTVTQYDALGRPLTITDGGNGTTSYQYIQNDVLQTVGPSPTFQKQYQYNGMGQLTSVCEVNGLPGSGPCTGQTNAESGYLTTYSNDPLGNILSVNEAGQARTYTFDGLSRLTQEINPESGTTTYAYDTHGTNCGADTENGTGQLAEIDYANGDFTCYGLYDSLGRLTAYLGSIPHGTSQDGVMCRRFSYDNSTGLTGTIPSGITISNPNGRMVEAETDDCYGLPVPVADVITDEWFSYDKDGRQTDLYESTPNSGGYYHTTAQYWANNSVNTLSGVPGLSGWSFLPDGEGRPYSATYGASTNWVKSATYYPTASQTTVTFGNGDSDLYSFDSAGRMNGFTFTVGSTPKTLAGTVGWNANWTLGAMAINDGFNSANTQNCSYGFDALARISSVSCANSAGTNIWGQNFTFDAFGNITKTVPPSDTGTSFQPTYSAATNQYTLSGCTITYDLSGNLTNDCFNTYTWTPLGEPMTIGSKAVTYDAFGREVEIDAGSTHTEVLYSPIGKLGLMNGQAPKVTRFPLPGGSTAEIIATNGQDRTLHSDWLGSSRLSTTYGARALAYDVAYSPYGEAYVASGSASGDLDFTGMFQDTQTGLYDFQAREYSIVGRWISPDPAGLGAADAANPQSWNRYAYVDNNPLSAIDPLGMDCVYINAASDGSDRVTVIHDNEDTNNCAGNNAFYFDGTVSDWHVDTNNNVVATVNGALQCQGDSGCSIYNNLTTLTINGGTAAQIALLPSPDQIASDVIDRPITATIGNVPNGKEQYCQARADQAAQNAVLPGLSTPTGRKNTAELAMHYGAEVAEGSTAFKLAVRSYTGVAMSTTGKLITGLGAASVAYSSYEALKAAQEEYKACMSE